MASSYKARHEEFVSGLTGGNVLEVYAISGVILLAYVIWWGLSRRLLAGFARSATDFFFNWAVPLLALTVYAQRLPVLASLVGAPILMFNMPAFARPAAEQNQREARARAVATESASVSEVKVSGGSRSKRTNAPKRPPALARPASADFLASKPFVTVYRASMLILTATAILAVDFRIFPRRFAKVETWGTSLMDLGVGSFVFSMGIVSARPILKGSLDLGAIPSLGSRLRSAFGHTAKLLVLGLARLAAVKFLGYQEHETEYGVHWNFFMTLGMLPPFATLVQSIVSRVPLVVIGIAVALGYELALKNTGLQEWVLAAPRTTLLSQNKEGVSSFVGYLAILLIGQSVGLYVLPSVLGEDSSLLFPPTKRQLEKPAAKSGIRVAARLILSAVFFHALYVIFSSETQVSRRLANFPYILWVCGYNTGILGLYALAAEFLGAGASDSQIAVNSHGQSMFLLCNLLTGLVNMAVHTIDMPPQPALVTLLAYLLVLYGAAFLL